MEVILTWEKIYDDADAPPSLSKVVAAGFRRAARYGGSQSWKAITAAERDQLHAAGLGIQPMYESAADSALTGGYSGGQAQAKAARAFWRNLGCPDSVPIAYAVDTNVDSGDHAALKAYFEGVNSVDTCKPVAYIEDDIGELLYSDGLIIGIFTPAAYAWNSPTVLYTPSNAPTHVLWTQEHNGVTSYGGDIDTGHIRSETPCWSDMTISTTDAQTIINEMCVKANAAKLVKALFAADGVWANYSWMSDAATNPTIATISNIRDGATEAHNAKVVAQNVKSELDGVKSDIGIMAGDIVSLKTAVAAIPTTALPSGPLSDQDKDDIAARVVAQLRAHPLEPAA